MAEIIQIPAQEYGESSSSYHERLSEWRAAQGWRTQPSRLLSVTDRREVLAWMLDCRRRRADMPPLFAAAMLRRNS